MRFSQLVAPTLAVATAMANPVELAPRAASVTKIVATSCSYTSVTPSPSQYICGVEGAIKKIGTDFYNGAAALSEEVCLSFCKAESECISYSYNIVGNECKYYNATIKGSNFLESDSGAYFWNKHCFAENCVTSTSTSTIAKTTSKSSSKTSSTAKITTTSTAAATTTAKTSSTSTKKASTTAKTTATSTCTTPSTATSACAVIDAAIVGNVIDTIEYTLYYSGKGETENPTNPGNEGALLAAETIELSGALSLCDAAEQCANTGGLLGLADIYESFDLHFVKTSCAWECVLYNGANTDSSYFDVKNTSIGAVVGFSGQLITLGIL